MDTQFSDDDASDPEPTSNSQGQNKERPSSADMEIKLRGQVVNQDVTE